MAVGTGVAGGVGRVGDGVPGTHMGQVGRGVGTGVGRGVGEGVGRGVGDGVGRGVGDSVGRGVGEGVGCGVSEGVGRPAGEGWAGEGESLPCSKGKRPAARARKKAKTASRAPRFFP